MERLRIGVIGLGWFGEIHCETIVGVPNLELAALCTRTPERLAALAGKFGVQKTYRDYRDLLADPEIDAVSIVTMWDQHTEPAIAALEAGKHVFLEKPMASTVADCQAILAAAAAAKGILLVGHICRFNPRYRMAKQAIDEGHDRQDRLAQLAPQHPGRLDAGDPQQDRPDRRRRDPRHRPDAVVHRRQRRQRLRADGRRARSQVPRHRPDDVPLRRRRDGDARDRLVHAGEARRSTSTSA